jgi:hypothetical protein
MARGKHGAMSLAIGGGATELFFRFIQPCQIVASDTAGVPDLWPLAASNPTPKALGFAIVHSLADLNTANRHVAEGERRIAYQRRRIAEQEGAGHDTRLSKQVLRNFEITLQLLIEHRDTIGRELGQISK